MSSDALRKELSRVPFAPPILFLPSGKALTISNPELTLFSETGRTLVVAQRDRFVHVDVATVEAIGTAAS